MDGSGAVWRAEQDQRERRAREDRIHALEAENRRLRRALLEAAAWLPTAEMVERDEPRQQLRRIWAAVEEVRG